MSHKVTLKLLNNRRMNPPVLRLLALNLAALALFAFGFVAPLTPSEGYPSLQAIAVFALTPSLIFVYLIVQSRSRWLAVVLAIQLLANLVFWFHLLRLQSQA